MDPDQTAPVEAVLLVSKLFAIPICVMCNAVHTIQHQLGGLLI